MVTSQAQSQPAQSLIQKESQALQRLRHTSAHILAMAVQTLFPETKVTIGPTTDNGFYYDFDRKKPFTPEDLSKIEVEMRRIIQANLPIICEVVEREQIRDEIRQLGEPYKLEILDTIPECETITRYFIGSPEAGKMSHSRINLEASLLEVITLAPSEYWWDLCAGPHLNFTGEINPNALALESVAAAYWRGDEKKPMLQRIYGTAWETPEQLQAYLQQKAAAKLRDNRKIGQELNLFSIQEDAGGGLVFWHPRGAAIRYIIEDYWRKAHLESGYELLYTPHVANLDL